VKNSNRNPVKQDSVQKVLLETSVKRIREKRTLDAESQEVRGKRGCTAEDKTLWRRKSSTEGKCEKRNTAERRRERLKKETDLPPDPRSRGFGRREGKKKPQKGPNLPNNKRGGYS